MTRHECDYSLYDWPDLGWDEQAHDMRPSLLIGNGFSKNIWSGFGYGSLFEEALQNRLVRLTDTDRAVFEAFGTNNFEVVLNVLAAGKAVSKALGQNHELLCASTIFHDALGHHESRIRKALIQAVHSVHISPSEFLKQDFLTIAIELAKYMSIYYTNYDLLIYWSMMKYQEYYRNHFFDYFWSNPFDIGNIEVSNKRNRSGVYFLHGGLHLYKDIIGQTFKRTNAEMNLLNLFQGNDTDKIPLFISEGTYKLQSIYQSDYLSFVFSCFTKDSNPLVILGHSLGDSDQHVANAINAHMDRPVAISVRKNGNIPKKKAAIRHALPNVELSFFDAATHPLLHESLRIEEAPQ